MFALQICTNNDRGVFLSWERCFSYICCVSIVDIIDICVQIDQRVGKSSSLITTLPPFFPLWCFPYCFTYRTSTLAAGFWPNPNKLRFSSKPTFVYWALIGPWTFFFSTAFLSSLVSRIVNFSFLIHSASISVFFVKVFCS